MSEKMNCSEEFLIEHFGIHRQRLVYWRKIGLLPPVPKGRPRGDGYSFTDLLSIKVILKLSRDGVSVGRIKRSVDAIKKRMPRINTPLTGKKLFIAGKDVCYKDKNVVYKAIDGQGQLFRVGDDEVVLKGEIKQHRKKVELRMKTRALVSK